MTIFFVCGDEIYPAMKLSYNNGNVIKPITCDEDLQSALKNSKGDLEVFVEVYIESQLTQDGELNQEAGRLERQIFHEPEKPVDIDLTIEGEAVRFNANERDIDSVAVIDDCDESFQFTNDDDDDYGGNIVDESEEDSDTSMASDEEIEEHMTSGYENDGLSDVDGNMEGMTVDSDMDCGKKEIEYLQRSCVGQLFSYEPNGKIKLYEGRLFNDVYHFRKILQDYLIQEGFDVQKLKNEKARVTVICKSEGCPWRLHASPCPDGVTYKIKTMVEEHICVMQTKFREVTDTWIAEKLRDQFRVDPNKSIASIAGDLQTIYEVQGVHKSKLIRARTKARRKLEGDHTECISKLPGYAELVLKFNAGSVVKIGFHHRPSLDVAPMFNRMFISLAAAKLGFLKGCRPFIGVDGCFLKGLYGGVLLVDVSLDGNNGIVPLATCVVEAECKDSWKYFFNALKESIGNDRDGTPWTFMSDRQKGLVDAVREVFPTAYQRFCCRHIEANLRVRFKTGNLKKYLWRAVKQATTLKFQSVMRELEKESKDCHTWLSAIASHLWSRHGFDRRCKVDHVTNNMTESFNGWINDHRHLPFLSLFEEIRLKTMRRFHDRYQKACSWNGVVCPKVRDTLNASIHACRMLKVIPAGTKQFQVLAGRVQYMVDLRLRICSCEEWDVSGIPCAHGVGCIISINEDIKDFVDIAYTIQTYQAVYSEIVHPQPDVSNIITTQTNGLRPPPQRRKLGRPKMNRRRELHEIPATQRSSTLKCSRCKEFGHDRRTCQNPFIKAKDSTRTATHMGDIPRAPIAREQAGPSRTKIPCKRHRTQSTSNL